MLSLTGVCLLGLLILRRPVLMILAGMALIYRERLCIEERKKEKGINV